MIVNTFIEGKPVEDFCSCPRYDRVSKMKYSLLASQYFDVKIRHKAVSEADFKKSMKAYQKSLTDLFNEGKTLEKTILDGFKEVSM